MASPAYIEPAYVSVISATTDVQDILDDMRTNLLAIGWTEPSANTFKTPVNSNGRFFQVAFTRSSATSLTAVMTDDFARAGGTCRFDITGATQVCAVYYGAHYVHIENRSQEDWIWFSMLSLSPESETAHQNYCTFGSRKNSAGSAVGNATLAFGYNVTGGAYDTVAGNSGNIQFFTNASETTSSHGNSRTPSGARRWYPAWVTNLDASSVRRFRGRLYNILLAWDSVVNVGSEYSIPIDEATVAAFRVLNMTVNTANGSLRRAIRVPTS